MKNQQELISKEHHDRSDLVGEHRWGDLGQVILFMIFLAVWVADSFIFHYSDFLKQYIPLYVRLPIGIVVLFIAAYLAKAGLNIVFGQVRDELRVIRNGVFGMVRHPIYLGAILLYLGMLIITFSIAAAVLLILILLFYHFIARYEEKLLMEAFGDDYKKYIDEVPMWTPWI